MLHSHCRAICYDRHDWPFVADRGISLAFQVWLRCDGSQYVLIRFVPLKCDQFTFVNFTIMIDGVHDLATTGPDRYIYSRLTTYFIISN